MMTGTEWPDGLRHQVLYTDMEAAGLGSEDKAYYKQLNAIQRSEDWDKISPFLRMLKLQVGWQADCMLMT